MQDEFHRHHKKHYQLGVELDKDGVPLGDNREMLPEDQQDSVWSNATTVEQFKEDIELLAAESEKE